MKYKYLPWCKLCKWYFKNSAINTSVFFYSLWKLSVFTDFPSLVVLFPYTLSCSTRLYPNTQKPHTPVCTLWVPDMCIWETESIFGRTSANCLSFGPFSEPHLWNPTRGHLAGQSSSDHSEGCHVAGYPPQSWSNPRVFGGLACNMKSRPGQGASAEETSSV